MVGHEDIRIEVDTELAARLPEVPSKNVKITRRAKDVCARIAAVHEMNRHVRDEDPRKPRHIASNVPRTPGKTGKWCLAPFILFFLAGCSLIDPHNMIGRQLGALELTPNEVVPSPRPETLDAQARERAIDFVWRTIDEYYYDPTFHGVDWRAVRSRYEPLALAAPNDEAFWDVLDKMTGELRDAHTRVESPRRVALRKEDAAITLGFSFAPIDGRLIVSSVNRDSDAWWAGVRPGMAVITIAGIPAMEEYEHLEAETRLDSTERSRHARALRRLLGGEYGTKVTFTFERADATRFDATLSRRRISTAGMETHRILPSGFGYLRFTEWSITTTARALHGLGELAKAPGLVIDLRGNPGGSAHAVNLMLERFFSKPTEVGRVITRNGEPVSLFFGAVEIFKLKRVVEGSRDAYKGPVAIILDAQSASASELVSGTMQAAGRARIVGEPSCGCLLGFLGYARVPGGADLAYSEVGFILSNGKRIEGEGVIPDVPVPMTLADLRMGRDRALEEAQATLARMEPAQ